MGSSARRVIAAEAYVLERYPVAVEVAPRVYPVEHRTDGNLEIAADRQIVFSFPLPRTVEPQRRDAAIEKRSSVGIHFFLRGVESDAHDEYGRPVDAHQFA